ncbi:hypothetical protein [Mycetocola sp. 2940]|uniref:hypothetical protein n=1 Tax=Mycetocola sp. 2940 TaxID=3156452 RepID=UPI003390DB4A
MDKNKIWSLASVIVMIGVLALGWFAGIDPLLKARAATEEQRVSVEAQNEATQLAIARLKGDFENIDALKAELVELRTSVPAAGSMPAFLTQLDTLARESNTTVKSLSVSEAIEYTAPSTAVEEPPAAEPAPDSEAPAPAPVEAEPETPSVITDSRITSANFIAIPITVTVNGDKAGTRSFLDKLQHGPRLFMATQVSTGPVGDDGVEFTATVSGYVYVLLKD